MKKGFTLIELLVVIAIIALLLAIIMPSLRTAKEMAAAVVCLSNEKQMMVAAVNYSQNNKESMVVPFTSQGVGADGKQYIGWVSYPQDINGNQKPVSDHTLQEEINGIRKGSLFPYYQDEKLLHCPMDRRSLKPPTNLGIGSTGTNVGGYRTFSIVLQAGENMNFYPQGFEDELISRKWVMRKGEICTKYSDIKNPGAKFVFVEENDNRGLNCGSWCMDVQTPGFVDPFAVFHNMRSLIGFADGHAEKVVWQDKRTEKYSDELNNGRTEFRSTDAEHANNPDLIWLRDHYARK